MARYDSGGGGGGGGAVSSVFGRIGAVTAALNDYATSLIHNDSGVFGASTLSAALLAIAAAIPSVPVSSVFGRAGAIAAALNDYASSLIHNDSGVFGASTLSDALVAIAAAIPSVPVSSVFGRTGAVSAANNDYSAQQIFQLDIQAVKAVCTSNISLTGALTSDGYTFLNGDRALVAFQTLAAENGIYTVNTGGAWARSSDQDVSGEFRPGVWFKIINGTIYGGNVACLLTPQQPSAIVVGTTAIQYGISSPSPVPVSNDGNTLVPSGGIITYVNSPSHKETRVAQTASLAAITLLTAPPADLYSLDSYIEYTAGTGTVLITFSYTDAIGATNQATVALVAVGRQQAHFSVNVASGNVTFTTTVTGTVTYNVNARAGRLLSTN